MKSNTMIGIFDNEQSFVAATREVRASGFTIRDAYTPYAVHGIEEAMGLDRSKLTFACLGLGLTGMFFALLFQVWTASVEWPINVGGKSFSSLPAMIPISFELTVLFAAVGTAFLFLLVSRLWPGRRAEFLVPEALDDRFALVLEVDVRQQTDAESLMRDLNAVQVRVAEAIE